MTHKEALEKIVQASDVSLNSGKSMQQIHELATTAISNYKEGKRYSEGQMKVAMLRVVKEFSKTPREGRMSFSELMNDVIQSLSPKGGKEEVILDAFNEGVNEGVNAGYELSLEPNQTEAENERIELNIDNILIQQGNHPNNVRNPIYYEERECARQGFALARKQVIEELEKWVKEEWFGAKEDDMTYYEHVVNADELLTKLQELCKK